MQKNKWFLVVPFLLIITVVAGFALTQNKYGKAAARGPYRAFLTKPVLGLGRKAGTLYREHEMVGAVLNDLHLQGFEPFQAEMLTEEHDGRRTNRLLIICRQ